MHSKVLVQLLHGISIFFFWFIFLLNLSCSAFFNKTVSFYFDLYFYCIFLYVDDPQTTQGKKVWPPTV